MAQAGTALGQAPAVVTQRLNRRKIDLIAEPEWADPPKARIAELLEAMQRRLQDAGLSGLGEAVDIATAAARTAGVADARVTTDAKHIEIGLKYLPQVARRLHHCRDLGPAEPFDFLTWFEYAPSDSALFDELLQALRASPEWQYVDREVDIRLAAERS